MIGNTPPFSAGSTISDLDGYSDGMSIERQELFIEVTGGEIFLDVNAVGGKDITYPRSTGADWILDCTTGEGAGGRARVQLLKGASDIPQENYIYVGINDETGNPELFTSAIPPSNDFAWVAYAVVLDDVKTLAEDPLVLQRTTEAITHNGRGAIAWERENIRFGAGHDRLLSGCDQSFSITTNAGSEDNLSLQLTNAIVFQLHRQSWDSYDITSKGLWVCNSDGAGGFDNYTKFTDLKDVLNEIKDGTALNDGDSINFYIWGAINYGDMSKVFINLSSGKDTVDADAIVNANGYLDDFIPKEFRSVAFPIMRGVLKWNTADNGTWANLLSPSVNVWKTKTIDSKTTNYPSNYPNNMNIIQTFSQTGALSVRMFMKNFNMETNWDFAEFKNATDPFSANVTARRASTVAFSGNLAAFVSPAIPGTTIRVNYTSDGSVQRSGANSDEMEYLVAVPGTGSGINDLRGSGAKFVF